MQSPLPAPFTKLLEFNFTLDLFAVFGRPVINPLTLTTGKFDQMVLGHRPLAYYLIKKK